MAALAHAHPDQTAGAPAFDHAAFLAALPPIAERLDTRAFIVIQNRAEAEYLLARDYTQPAADTAWTALFVESLVEFLVWQNQPSGRIAQNDLDWFIGLVGDAPSPSVPALLFALVRELNEVPEQLTALALRHAKNRLALSH